MLVRAIFLFFCFWVLIFFACSKKVSELESSSCVPGEGEILVELGSEDLAERIKEERDYIREELNGGNPDGPWVIEEQIFAKDKRSSCDIIFLTNKESEQKRVIYFIFGKLGNKVE